MKYLFFVLTVFATPYVDAQIIVTVAGTGVAGYNGNGIPATNAKLDNPIGVAIDDVGDLYICDLNNARIRKVSPAWGGTITTVAGNGLFGYSGDGGPATAARLESVYQMAIDSSRNLYLADAGNNCIRKVSADGIISTIAGTGVAGFSGDGTPATTAQLNSPLAVAVDDSGNVFIGDAHNYRLRKINSAGVITTIAGTGTSGFSGDGGSAALAQISKVFSMVCDKHGNLYFMDSSRIRKISADGIITTVAGTGVRGYNGEGMLAMSADIAPNALAIDSVGNIYIADNTDRIRKINTEGVVNTVAGNGLTGDSGDWGAPLTAELYWPEGIAVNRKGEVFFSNQGSHKVRMISNLVTGTKSLAPGTPMLMIYPNPSTSEQYSIILKAKTNKEIELVVYDATGVEIAHSVGRTNKKIVLSSPGKPGVYTIKCMSGNEVTTGRLVVK